MDGYLARQLALTFKPEFLVTTETLLKLAPTVVCDDELLPFKANSFDLIVSNLNFQQLNLIPQFLTQVLSILKPKGIFMATFFGEESLLALKEIVYQVELDLYGSASPRFAPVIDLKTAANLLAKTGFSDPIATCEKIMVSYADPLKLLRDLKMMGQSNILTKRSRQFFSKKFLAEIIKRYQKIPETIFEIITITAKKS